MNGCARSELLAAARAAERFPPGRAKYLFVHEDLVDYGDGERALARRPDLAADG